MRKTATRWLSWILLAGAVSALGQEPAPPSPTLYTTFDGKRSRHGASLPIGPDELDSTGGISRLRSKLLRQPQAQGPSDKVGDAVQLTDELPAPAARRPLKQSRSTRADL